MLSIRFEMRYYYLNAIPDSRCIFREGMNSTSERLRPESQIGWEDEPLNSVSGWSQHFAHISVSDHGEQLSCVENKERGLSGLPRKGNHWSSSSIASAGFETFLLFIFLNNIHEQPMRWSRPPLDYLVAITQNQKKSLITTCAAQFGKVIDLS